MTDIDVYEKLGKIEGTLLQIDERLDKVESLLTKHLFKIGALATGITVMANIIILLLKEVIH
mgnify:CR=1 FL=1